MSMKAYWGEVAVDWLLVCYLCAYVVPCPDSSWFAYALVPAFQRESVVQ